MPSGLIRLPYVEQIKQLESIVDLESTFTSHDTGPIRDRLHEFTQQKLMKDRNDQSLYI